MRVGLVIVLAALVARQSWADSVTFDFAADGIGPEFSTSQDHPFWTITTDATGLRMSKPADDGSSFAVPFTRTGARVTSAFTFGGDFIATLEFSWNQTATPSFSAGDNSASFILTSALDPTYIVAVSSVSLWNGTQRVDVGYSPPLAALPAGTAFPTPLASTLVFTRTGSGLTFSWGSNVLNTLALPPQLQGDVFVSILAHQGQGSGHPTFTGIDPRDPMDVSFRQLTIIADTINVPEPSTLTLISICLYMACRRKKRVAASTTS